MKRITSFLASVALLVMLFPGTAAANAVLYKNVTLIDPQHQEVTPNTYLLIRDGRFEYVGQELPQLGSHVEVIDLHNDFVTPGFIDTHAHISLGAVSFTIEGESFALHADNQQAIAQWNAQKLLQFGVTSIRNPGGDTRANMRYKRAQLAGEIIGPRAYVAGGILNNMPFAGLVEAVNDEASIESAIRYQAEQGVDFIKLYTGLREAQIEIAVREASLRALPTIGHLESVSWQRGAEIGIDHLVHAMPISPDLLAPEKRESYVANARPGTFGFFEWFAVVDLEGPEMQAMIAALKENEVSVDPTLIVFYNAFFGDQSFVTEHPELAAAHPDLVKNWQEFYHFNLGWSAADFALAQATWPKVLEFVNRLHQQGVNLTVGTDLGNPWVIPGVSYFQELMLLSEAGIEPFDLLRLATVNGARVLGQAEQLGQIETGYFADFLVFSENPATEIDNLNSLHRVVQSGNTLYHSQAN